jgi:DNA-binding transcriptional regulator YiaG
MDEAQRYRIPRNRGRPWTAAEILALRRRLGLSQAAFAGEIGVRQQTVSEWETGRYQPRGATARLLGMLAETSGIDEPAGVPGEESP